MRQPRQGQGQLVGVAGHARVQAQALAAAAQLHAPQGDGEEHLKLAVSLGIGIDLPVAEAALAQIHPPQHGQQRRQLLQLVGAQTVHLQKRGVAVHGAVGAGQVPGKAHVREAPRGQRQSRIVAAALGVHAPEIRKIGQTLHLILRQGGEAELLGVAVVALVSDGHAPADGGAGAAPGGLVIVLAGEGQAAHVGLRRAEHQVAAHAHGEQQRSRHGQHQRQAQQQAGQQPFGHAFFSSSLLFHLSPPLCRAPRGAALFLYCTLPQGKKEEAFLRCAKIGESGATCPHPSALRAATSPPWGRHKSGRGQPLPCKE